MWYDTRGTGRYYWPYYRSTYRGLPLWEIDRRVEPSAQAEQQAPVPPDEGIEAIRDGRYAAAVRIFQLRDTDRRALELASAEADTETDDEPAVPLAPDRSK